MRSVAEAPTFTALLAGESNTGAAAPAEAQRKPAANKRLGIKSLFLDNINTGINRAKTIDGINAGERATRRPVREHYT